MLHLEDALEELYTPHVRGTQDKRTMLVLTFDDGYHDNYTHAFSLARELQVPITIFLIPGYLESGAPFWWKEGRRLVQRAGVDEVTIEDRMYHLNQPEERRQLTQFIDKRLRYVGSVAEREAFLAEVSRILEASSTVEEGERPLTWAEVLEMQESGWVSFGAHTMHHPILGYLVNPAEVRRKSVIAENCCKNAWVVKFVPSPIQWEATSISVTRLCRRCKMLAIAGLPRLFMA
jgi:peptidoglycan/xylan/chitin deacetylase (PgdA/CDA1 family)